MKYFYLSLFFCLNFFKLIGQEDTTITPMEKYYEAYKNSYGILDMGTNASQKLEIMEFQIFEKTETYMKFGIELINLYVEMALFQGEDEFVVLHKYYNEDFRASIQKLQCLVLNSTPIGNPLDEVSALSKDEIYAYYYQNIALMQAQTTMGTNDRRDINYQKIILPKNGENLILLQYGKPKVENGAVVETVNFVGEKVIVNIDAKFKTWGTLNFQKMSNYFEFESR